MAKGKRINDLTKTFIAGADLSAKQYYFVELSADNTVTVCNAITDRPIGVLQNKPTSGQAAEVLMVGVSKISADVALTAGNPIYPSTDGQAAIANPGTTTTVYLCGQVIEGASAASALATAAINCISVARAA